MATYTENYNLEKPAQSDLYNIDVFNENADKIDEALGSKASNQSLAPIESSATASRNYSVGQQFVYNGLLYEATSAIASGGTITPGSNCARTTVAEELSALNDSLANTDSAVSFLSNYVQHYGSTNVSAKLTAYSSAICLALVSGIGSSIFGVRRTGNSITKTHIDGTQSATDAITITPAGTDNVSITASGATVTITIILSN